MQGQWAGVPVFVEGDSELTRGRGKRAWRECLSLQLAKVGKVWQG